MIDQDKPVSSSIVDVFCIFGDVIEFAKKFQFLQPPGENYLQLLARVNFLFFFFTS